MSIIVAANVCGTNVNSPIKLYFKSVYLYKQYEKNIVFVKKSHLSESPVTKCEPMCCNAHAYLTLIKIVLSLCTLKLYI